MREYRVAPGEIEAQGTIEVTDASGACPLGLGKPLPAPMVHVWIVKNKCGPFAALEGIGGGRIAPGQKRLCDHVHGSTS